MMENSYIGPGCEYIHEDIFSPHALILRQDGAKREEYYVHIETKGKIRVQSLDGLFFVEWDTEPIKIEHKRTYNPPVVSVEELVNASKDPLAKIHLMNQTLGKNHSIIGLDGGMPLEEVAERHYANYLNHVAQRIKKRLDKKTQA